uniref:Putative cdk9 kinase-activating protein cyclin t n=1 Tax=Ornithodoros turicata TaxID=34597 RepID=A0A2R5LKS1_9ACAR
MAAVERWYFTKEQLACTPSRKCGLDADKELSYRQQAANLIQDIGQRLSVTQLCINTAIVYMHRFYYYHSFTKFHRNAIAACALFLAAKVEEQPRKLEHVIKVAHVCLHRDAPALNPNSEAYQEQALELVFNENVMLQTLGFDIGIDHPHTYVVKCCQLVRASKDLAQTSYFMATNSLHLTMMCLQYKPTVVACLCIHLACKWSNWEIPKSSEDKDWFWYVDKSCTAELLEELTSEFLAILDKCPIRLKRKIMSGGASASTSGTASAATAGQSSSKKDVMDKRMLETSRPQHSSSNHAEHPSADSGDRTGASRKAHQGADLQSGSSGSSRLRPNPTGHSHAHPNRSPTVPSSLQPPNQGSEHLLSPGKRKLESAPGQPLSLDAYRDKRHKQKSQKTLPPDNHQHMQQSSVRHQQPTNHDTNFSTSTTTSSSSLVDQKNEAPSEVPQDNGGLFHAGMGYPAMRSPKHTTLFEGDSSLDSFLGGLDGTEVPVTSPLHFDGYYDSQDLPSFGTTEESNGLFTSVPTSTSVSSSAPVPVPPAPPVSAPAPAPLPVNVPPQPVAHAQRGRPPTPPPPQLLPPTVKQDKILTPPLLPPPPPPVTPQVPSNKEKEKSERKERKERHKHKHSSSEKSKSKHSSPSKQERALAELRVHNSERVPDLALHKVAEAPEASKSVAAPHVPGDIPASVSEKKAERNGIGKHDRRSSGKQHGSESKREKSERREKDRSREEKSREDGGTRSSQPSSGGLKITISKEMLQQSGGTSGSPPREALKIKIPKLKIVPPTPTESELTATPPPSGLKLKISKDRLHSGRKRDRRGSSSGGGGNDDGQRSPKSRKTNSHGSSTANMSGAAAQPFVGYPPTLPQIPPPPLMQQQGYYNPHGYHPQVHVGAVPTYMVPQYFGIPPPPPPPLPTDPPLPKEPPLPPPPPPTE